MNLNCTPCICIVGLSSFQNLLLASYLENQTGSRCRWFKNISLIPKSDIDPKNTLFLLEAIEGNIPSNSCLIKTLSHNAIPNVLLSVVFNMPPDEDLEFQMFNNGHHGYFRYDIKPENFIKGISSIYEGELWFSRNIMIKALKGSTNNNHSEPQEKPTHSLTLREIEILNFIAKGDSNKQIANNLNLSEHTIKTHIYNTFKKIKTNSRTEAAVWAKFHL